MPAFSLIPSKEYICTRSAEKIKLVKDVLLDNTKWGANGSLYVYNVTDSDVTLDSCVFINSYKEYYSIIKDSDVMLLYPDVMNGTIKIYAMTKPESDISINYTIIKENVGVLNDKSSDISYRDNCDLGTTNVQTALDKVASIVNPCNFISSLNVSDWVSVNSGEYISIEVESPEGYILTDKTIKISLAEGATLNIAKQYKAIDMFFIKVTSSNKISIYGIGSIPNIAIPIKIEIV